MEDIEDSIVPVSHNENLRDEVKKMVQMKYENRREFYECPFEDGSVASWVHYIGQREGDLKKFNKSLDKLLKKCRGHKLESINSDLKYVYKFKLEGIDRWFEF